MDEFLKTIQNLDYVQVSDPEGIPEAHKEKVRERISKSEENPERLISWQEAKSSLKTGL